MKPSERQDYECQIQFSICEAHNNSALRTNPEERVKDEFYEQLQREVERATRHYVLIIMGYANAKVGQDNLR